MDSQPLEWVGEPGECDACGRPLKTETFFCDTELPARGGQWGLLCRTCTVVEGIRPGWGRAQFYEKQRAKGTLGAGGQEAVWRCVAGGPSSDSKISRD